MLPYLSTSLKAAQFTKMDCFELSCWLQIETLDMKTFCHKDFSRLLTEFAEFAARRFISASAKDQITFAQHLVSFWKPVQIALPNRVSYKRFSGKNKHGKVAEYSVNRYPFSRWNIVLDSLFYTHSPELLYWGWTVEDIPAFSRT